MLRFKEERNRTNIIRNFILRAPDDVSTFQRDTPENKTKCDGTSDVREQSKHTRMPYFTSQAQRTRKQRDPKMCAADEDAYMHAIGKCTTTDNKRGGMGVKHLRTSLMPSKKMGKYTWKSSSAGRIFHRIALRCPQWSTLMGKSPLT